ncbi:MAG: hypothetical protein O3A82_11135 [Verrucomicrobia bacterium]|nr:hypothetical protein [Verrucomicrobiota bacterium]MDA0722742.1 hypothetical protein [Verrucomicrobiota bacterium]MDA1047470.1 hypothetical protein [Verrucomicrobiota bacterium]
MPSRQERAADLLENARLEHQGIFLTGPNEIRLLSDELPASAFDGNGFVLAGFGNCRCASDAKAIRQFDAHARVPHGVNQIALGHETLQLVLQAPEDSGFVPGDLVVVTPGHSSEPIDPSTFAPASDGVLAALGYSYRHLGGLRAFNAVPGSAPAFLKQQGFGNLFNKVGHHPDISLVSLAHAEPFACNYGTNKHVFTIGSDGEFRYGVPPRATVAYLSGTARMAMINLTIVAAVPDDELPSVVYITGSPGKLADMEEYALIRDLRRRGSRVVLIDRSDPEIISKLTEFGKSEVIWTNYASQATYDQACEIIADGGNLNSYAGASDPDLLLPMSVAHAPGFASIAEEVTAQIGAMHHNLGPNDPRRHRGLDKEPRVALLGFDGQPERVDAYLKALPGGTEAHVPGDDLSDRNLRSLTEASTYTDVFIASTGEEAAALYRKVEGRLARSAAVNFIDGDLVVPIGSRHAHYVSRHQICGSNVPWHMTNTSEPHSDDMVQQAQKPVDFDWMVKGVCGLRHVPVMMEKVESEQPFGSFFAFTELPDIPYVEVSAAAFDAAAENAEKPVRTALELAAQVLRTNGEVWSREVEQALYTGYDKPYPLDLS